MSDTEYRVSGVHERALAIIRAKNDNYGSSWRHQGWRGNLSRILEKGDRMRAMLWRADPPLMNGQAETPIETLLDIMNTCAFMIVNIEDGVEYGHEPQAADIVPRMAMHPDQNWARGHDATALNPAQGSLPELPAPGEERPAPAPGKCQPGQ